MIKPYEALPFQKFPRVAVYAALAALVTIILFAADGAFRWYRGTSTQAANPLAHQRPVDASEATPETHHANSPMHVASRAAERDVIAEIEKRIEDQAASAQMPDPAIGSIANPAATPIPVPASRPVEAAPEQGQPKLSQQPQRQQMRRLLAQQKARDRTTSRRAAPAAKRPAQAAKPNVYWERDTQLGFAPQLRKRTCNPATGHMPMQCYYPREGRERFPSKPLE